MFLAPNWTKIPGDACDPKKEEINQNWSFVHAYTRVQALRASPIFCCVHSRLGRYLFRFSARCSFRFARLVARVLSTISVQTQQSSNRPLSFGTRWTLFILADFRSGLSPIFSHRRSLDASRKRFSHHESCGSQVMFMVRFLSSVLDPFSSLPPQ